MRHKKQKGFAVTSIFLSGFIIASISTGFSAQINSLVPSSKRAIVKADVAVIGAGYSGLLAARTIARAGYKVVIFEASDHIGGRAQIAKLKDGTIADLGAGWIIAPTHKRMLELAKEYGVTLYPQYTKGDGLFVWKEKVMRVPMTQLMVNPADPGNKKPVIQALQNIGRLTKNLDPNAPWLYPHATKLDSQAFTVWLDRYPLLTDLDKQLLATLIANYTGPVDQTSTLNVFAYSKMSHEFENYGYLPQWFRIEGGTNMIARKIAEELQNKYSVKIFLNQRVHSVYANHLNNKNLVLVKSESNPVVLNAGSHQVQASRVVITVPPIISSSIRFIGIDGKTKSRLGDHFSIDQRVPMSAGYKAFFLYPKPFWREDGLSGYVTGQIPEIAGIIDASYINKKTGCLMMIGANPKPLYTPGQRARYLSNVLATYFGPKALGYIDFREKIWSGDQLALGGIGSPSIGAWTSFGSFLRPPIGNIYWAGSERANTTYTQMNGAAESGIQVGNLVLNDMKALKKESVKN